MFINDNDGNVPPSFYDSKLFHLFHEISLNTPLLLTKAIFNQIKIQMKHIFNFYYFLFLLKFQLLFLSNKI